MRPGIAGVGVFMLAVAQPAPVPRPPASLPVLHHLIIVLDSATWQDVRVSPFLRNDFAGHDTAVSEDCRTLYGKYNYVALCRPGRRTPSRPGVHGPLANAGDVEIVLSYETPGALDRVERTDSFERSTDLAGPDLWYQVLRLAGADSTSDRAGFAFIQYTAEAAKHLAKTDSQPPTNLKNSRFLAGAYDPAKLLSYVSGATLAIPVGDIARISAVLERSGAGVAHEGEGVVITLDGFALRLIPPWAGAGVKQLRFALTHDLDANPIYTLGPKSRLHFGPGPIAVWDFR